MKSKFEKAVTFAGGHAHLRRYADLQNLPHWHREHELVFVEAGKVTLMTDGNLFTLEQGDVAFLHSEEPHSLCSKSGAVVAVVKLDKDQFRRLLDNRKLQSPVLRPASGIEEVLRLLQAEQRRADAYSADVIDCTVTRLLVEILRHNPLTEPGQRNDATENYKTLLDRIARDYAYVTFDEAAEMMHFSRPYFSKYFQKHAGMSFTRYLNTIRISVAVERLLQGGATVTEVSQSCGFNTIRNFNRVFKDLTGYTPGTLPRDYSFACNLHRNGEGGFDPTLGCTVVLD